MKKNKLVSFVHSLVLLPMMSMPLALGGVEKEIGQSVLVPKFNIELQGSSILASNQAKDVKIVSLENTRKVRAEAIDNYFKERGMPLEGTGMKMVLEAEKNNLDWRLLPAIAVRESTGGKFECKKVKNSAFGWGSCKINFKSNGEAIEIVAWNLGGNNPNTEIHYKNKTTREILRSYNPPSIVPNYVPQVLSIMSKIGAGNLGEEVNA